MKKSLFISFFAVCAGLFLAAPAMAYIPREGDLIKVSGNPAVYYIDSNGYRHLFTTESTFFSWYTGSWRDQSIITVSSYDFNQIPSGKNITVKPGYSLLKFENSQIMYAILPGGRLCYAGAYYGNYQYNRALIIPAGFQVDYYNDTTCNVTSGSKLPDGTLFRYSNSNDIYYVQNGLKRKVTSYGMSANNFHYESVVSNVDWSVSYSDGSVIDSRDYTISDLNYYLNTYNYYSNNYYNYGYNYNYNNYCTENWTCGSWSNCSSGYQYRTCWDLNSCGTTYNKPITGQSCYSYNYLCSENWTCGAWSSCAYGRSYRTCWDLNSCGTTNSKPAESQTCSACTENWSCTSWGACQTTGLSNGWQFRTCTDLNACGTTYQKPSTSQTCQTCQPSWSCTSWTTCSSGSQYRDCIDLNRCGSTSGKPTTSQSCS